MTDFPDSFSSSALDSKPPGGDKELQEFLIVEKQKAQFNAQVRLYVIRRLNINLYILIFFSRYMNLMTFAGINVWIRPAANWTVKQKLV